MKRMTIIVLGVAVAMLLALAPNAGAVTVTTAGTVRSSTKLLNEYQFCIAYGAQSTPTCQHVSKVMTGQAQPVDASSIQPHLSVSAGWKYYIHLSHADVSNAAFGFGVGGVFFVLGLMCGALFNPVAIAACSIYVGLVGLIVGYLITVASQKYDWYGNWYCDVAQASSCPGSWNLNAGTPFPPNWVYPVQDVGLTLGVEYWGTPGGYTFDYAGIGIS